MTIKIKAPRMWQYPNGVVQKEGRWFGEWRVRIVRESDWRKLMALVRAADGYRGGDDWWAQLDAIVVARDALEKKK